MYSSSFDDDASWWCCRLDSNFRHRVGSFFAGCLVLPPSPSRLALPRQALPSPKWIRKSRAEISQCALGGGLAVRGWVVDLDRWRRGGQPLQRLEGATVVLLPARVHLDLRSSHVRASKRPSRDHHTRHHTERSALSTRTEPPLSPRLVSPLVCVVR
jgi:hypothetical protein